MRFVTQSSKHRIPFKPRRRGSRAHLAGFYSRQGSRFIYTYDSMGRMLTRDDGTDLTQFTWDDQWNCIKEVTGESETVYHIPEGQILSFIRDGVTYQAHMCALGSIRMITDESGNVVAQYDFDAWGWAISVTENSELAGFPMRFVGSLGVRFDELVGMHYMRERWYDPTIQRFISRDPIGLAGGANLYAYCSNSPAQNFDPTGLTEATEIYYLGLTCAQIWAAVGGKNSKYKVQAWALALMSRVEHWPKSWLEQDLEDTAVLLGSRDAGVRPTSVRMSYAAHIDGKLNTGFENFWEMSNARRNEVYEQWAVNQDFGPFSPIDRLYTQLHDPQTNANYAATALGQIADLTTHGHNETLTVAGWGRIVLRHSQGNHPIRTDGWSQKGEFKKALEQELGNHFIEMFEDLCGKECPK